MGSPLESSIVGTSMRFWDITRPLRADMLIFPGDPAFNRTVLSFGEVTVSELRMGSHTGTHMDAPRHMIAGGRTMESIPLENFLRPAHLVTVCKRGSVDPEDLDISGVKPGEALLLKAPMGLEEEAVPIYLSPETASLLVERGIPIVGIDSLSVEAIGNESFPVHRTLLGAGVLILEGLKLSDVPEGFYHLIAMPLLVDGGDGAPVRAILVENLAEKKLGYITDCK